MRPPCVAGCRDERRGSRDRHRDRARRRLRHAAPARGCHQGLQEAVPLLEFCLTGRRYSFEHVIKPSADQARSLEYHLARCWSNRPPTPTDAGEEAPMRHFHPLPPLLALFVLAACGEDQSPTAPARRQRRAARPSVATAGHRVVNSLADPGNGTCNATQCTLREAINDAGSTEISFAPGLTGSITLAQPAGGGGTLRDREDARRSPAPARGSPSSGGAPIPTSGSSHRHGSEREAHEPDPPQRQDRLAAAAASSISVRSRSPTARWRATRPVRAAASTTTACSCSRRAASPEHGHRRAAASATTSVQPHGHRTALVRPTRPTLAGGIENQGGWARAHEQHDRAQLGRRHRQLFRRRHTHRHPDRGQRPGERHQSGRPPTRA